MSRQHSSPLPLEASNGSQLAQTLMAILERENQWLTAIKTLDEERLQPLADYLTDRTHILRDSIDVLTSGKYPSLSSASEEAKQASVDYIEFALAAHTRSCQNFNAGLVDKGVITVKLQPVSP